jgi:hypothetical protein
MRRCATVADLCSVEPKGASNSTVDPLFLFPRRPLLCFFFAGVQYLLYFALHLEETSNTISCPPTEILVVARDADQVPSGLAAWLQAHSGGPRSQWRRPCCPKPKGDGATRPGEAAWLQR